MGQLSYGNNRRSLAQAKYIGLLLVSAFAVAAPGDPDSNNDWRDNLDAARDAIEQTVGDRDATAVALQLGLTTLASHYADIAVAAHKGARTTGSDKYYEEAYSAMVKAMDLSRALDVAGAHLAPLRVAEILRDWASATGSQERIMAAIIAYDEALSVFNEWQDDWGDLTLWRHGAMKSRAGLYRSLHALSGAPEDMASAIWFMGKARDELENLRARGDVDPALIAREAVQTDLVHALWRIEHGRASGNEGEVRKAFLEIEQGFGRSPLHDLLTIWGATNLGRLTGEVSWFERALGLVGRTAIRSGAGWDARTRALLLMQRAEIRFELYNHGRGESWLKMAIADGEMASARLYDLGDMAHGVAAERDLAGNYLILAGVEHDASLYRRAFELFGHAEEMATARGKDDPVEWALGVVRTAEAARGYEQTIGKPITPGAIQLANLDDARAILDAHAEQAWILRAEALLND